MCAERSAEASLVYGPPQGRGVGLRIAPGFPIQEDYRGRPLDLRYGVAKAVALDIDWVAR